MKEYIEREEAERVAMYVAVEKDHAKELIQRIPAADVVEVVRCKDCDVPHNRWIGCRYLNGLIPPPDFYCACGKRKNDKEE